MKNKSGASTAKRADGSARRRKDLRKAEVVDIHATFAINNTVVTVSFNAQKLFQLSPPCLGFKGPKKPTPFAAQAVMNEAIRRLKEDHKTVAINNVFVSGPGPGRDVALRSIKLPVSNIIDVTPKVCNGCRPVAAKSKT